MSNLFLQNIEKEEAAELGVKFSDTPIGKEVDSIDRSILVGELSTIKKGLKINI